MVSTADATYMKEGLFLRRENLLLDREERMAEPRVRRQERREKRRRRRRQLHSRTWTAVACLGDWRHRVAPHSCSSLLVELLLLLLLPSLLVLVLRVSRHRLLSLLPAYLRLSFFSLRLLPPSSLSPTSSPCTRLRVSST